MARPLSRRAVRYLQKHFIDRSWIYHRSGEKSLSDAIQQMRNHDKWILHGFPCTCGFSLRSRDGDCLDCYPKQLEPILRYTGPGIVYLLQSPAAKMIKVGSTRKSAALRAWQLNGKGYGGVSDWDVAHEASFERHALFEDRLKSALHHLYVKVSYSDYGRDSYSRETYHCSLRTAKRVFRELEAAYAELPQETCYRLYEYVGPGGVRCSWDNSGFLRFRDIFVNRPNEYRLAIVQDPAGVFRVWKLLDALASSDGMTLFPPEHNETVFKDINSARTHAVLTHDQDDDAVT